MIRPIPLRKDYNSDDLRRLSRLSGPVESSFVVYEGNPLQVSLV